MRYPDVKSDVHLLYPFLLFYNNILEVSYLSPLNEF